ncbi:uncharacterized protein LOC127750234 [Frankliniella occidentalis]|uniref:Uncharacterized protein LOC127750234 n=1 Tax=Frankliniella occidentalis TaxID=133901 RepID=A0A9C6X147_FRAOC|nr:uncharacterized protein LOC127750234 [Frankliniella occidentalis]
MATSSVTMELLPDDVLVMVMQFLDVADVLACRLVCKRLCGLALHPDVWRHRSLSDDEPCASAVLRLAPCLNKLIVTGQVSTLAVTTTRCAVKKMILLATHTKATDQMALMATEYAYAVYKQESLGRLRHLELCQMYHLHMPVTDVLLRTVASCSDLKSLVFNSELPVTSTRVVHGPSRSSLTYFHCPFGESSASFLLTILAGHAATLEEISIGSDLDFEETGTADLLAAMPRLRFLKCEDSLRGFEVVAECKTLRRVHICLFGDHDEFDGLPKFLRRAKQLRRVHLENIRPISAEYSTALFEALTSPGRSHLERLTLEGFEDVRPLFHAKTSLSHLRYLSVRLEFIDDEMLLSITPVTAPALETLELRCREKCRHALIHRDAVKATLAANTSLHIQIFYGTRSKCEPQDCTVCAGGCHPAVEWAKVFRIGLFSHDPDKCPSLEAHTDDTECSWIHM